MQLAVGKSTRRVNTQASAKWDSRIWEWKKRKIYTRLCTRGVRKSARAKFPCRERGASYSIRVTRIVGDTAQRLMLQQHRVVWLRAAGESERDALELCYLARVAILGSLKYLGDWIVCRTRRECERERERQFYSGSRNNDVPVRRRADNGKMFYGTGFCFARAFLGYFQYYSWRIIVLFIYWFDVQIIIIFFKYLSISLNIYV